MRAWTGGGQPRFVQALQYRMPLVAPLHTTECFLRRSIPGGYGWVFPRGAVANVGVGVDPALGVRALDAQRAFVEELLGLGVVREQVLWRTGGVLPVSGLLALRRGRVLFAGDAAGQCHPITGAGIANAVMCGELAGAAAAEAATLGDSSPLDEYVEEVTELLGPILEEGAARRALQLATWGDPEQWAATLRRCWVAFDEYHRRPPMETTRCPA
jgi:flavin-dependent dehydrogenase